MDKVEKGDDTGIVKSKNLMQNISSGMANMLRSCDLLN